MDARSVSVLLLRVGSVPFALAIVLLSCASLLPDVNTVVGYDVSRLFHIALVCHGGAILGFIGGLQQATLHSPMLAVAAIAVAIIGASATLGAALRGDTPLEPLVLAVTYSWQACAEAQLLPFTTRHAMLHNERSLPMLLASLALLGLGNRASITGADWALVAAAATLTVPTNLILASRCLRSAPAPAAARRIAIGTINPCKIAAVRRTLSMYPEVVVGGGSAICAFSVPSGVPDQPLGMAVTAAGARNRAHAAYMKASAEAFGSTALIGLGIESGLFELDGAHYDVCIVSAYDGTQHHLGYSCAFQIPPTILEHVTARGLDLSQACNAAGITSDPKLGERGGLIGLLSGGRLTREDYTVQAVTTALFFATTDGRPWYRANASE